jgi:hypothetical protein
VVAPGDRLGVAMRIQALAPFTKITMQPPKTTRMPPLNANPIYSAWGSKAPLQCESGCCRVRRRSVQPGRLDLGQTGGGHSSPPSAGSSPGAGRGQRIRFACFNQFLMCILPDGFQKAVAPACWENCPPSPGICRPGWTEVIHHFRRLRCRLPLQTSPLPPPASIQAQRPRAA